MLAPLDHAAGAAALARLDALTKPRGSLGRLEALVAQLARVQGRDRPRARPAAALVVASDHAVARHGVSAYPQAVTRAMVANLRAGGAAASVMARALAVPLTVLDVGVLGGEGAGAEAGAGARVVRAPVAAEPLGDLREARAVTPEVAEAVARAAEGAVDAMGDLAVLLLGEIGIGNTTAAAAVASALLGLPPEASVGPGTGLDEAGLAVKRAVVADAQRSLGDERDPWRVLARVGGRDLVGMAAAARAALARRAVVVADGYAAGVALLALARALPGAEGRVVFAHRSAEPGHARVLAALGAEPLLDLGLRLGEGTGALAAFPLVELACALHDRMATFAEAAVPEREGAP
ncbi:MAG TPA: nicotinate-nucleotide--dimethylbenzimidazole phosphoribosyltransferase [Polyangiaceae bacterium]|nr:nicotinate-nucleotide--dimethylbenzimidazole phosphoribosyltransferase [Polyangiaceae bacterium]